jgi:nucleoside-diphosphate-sugar epimerase
MQILPADSPIAMRACSPQIRVQEIPMPTTPATPSPLHVVFGAGQIGGLLAAQLLAAGHRVRQVRRGPAGAARPGLEWLRGDATDPRFTTEAARGAAVVYDCTNTLDYHRWEERLPPLRAAIREGAARAGSRLVVLECLYMVGRPDRTPFDEDQPLAPCSRKGEVAARLTRELFEAHARGDVRATAGRAADFFGPGVRWALLGDNLLDAARAGRPAMMGGDPDQPHGYAYAPDVARGLAALGAGEAAPGKVWHLPLAWRGTTRQLVSALGKELLRQGGAAHPERGGARRRGVEGLRIRGVPDLVFRAAGLLDRRLGAAREMTYQWKLPYVLDDRRIREAFGVAATPAEVAVAETARWLRGELERKTPAEAA